MQRSQRGSVEIIIAIVAVVLILGAVGFVFWQNMSKKTSEPVANNQVAKTEDKPEVKKLETKINDAFGVSLSMRYPETWKLQSSIEGPVPLDETKTATIETVTLTSPSAKYSVVYKIAANGGLGGTCDINDSQNGTISQFTYEAIESFAGKYFATSILKSAQGKYIGYSGIIDEGSLYPLSAIKAGDSRCKLYLTDIIQLKKEQNVTVLDMSIHVKDMETSLNYSENVTSTQEQISAAFSGSEYDEAKAILMSTKLGK